MCLSYQGLQKGVEDFFILFRLGDIDKPSFCECAEIRVFLFLQITQVTK